MGFGKTGQNERRPAHDEVFNKKIKLVLNKKIIKRDLRENLILNTKSLTL